MSGELAIELTLAELAAVVPMLSMCAPDERSQYSDVQLLADGSARRWVCADPYHGGMMFTTAETRHYDVAVPPTLIRSSWAIAGDGEEVTLVVSGDHGRRTLTMHGDGGEMTVWEGVVSWADPDGMFNEDIEWAGSATFRSHVFGNLLMGESRVRPRSDEESGIDSPPFAIELGAGELVLKRRWEGVGVTRYGVPTEGAEGDVFVEVSAERLRKVMACFGTGQLVKLRIPRYNSDNLLFETEGLVLFLMARRNTGALLQDAVEKIIEEVAGPAAVQVDADGDYPLHNVDATIYGRLDTDSDPAVLQVFAVVLDAIESSVELLAEINQLNAGLEFARLYHADDQVVVQVDLVASALDAQELRNAIDRILDVDSRIKPMLATVFGGEAGVDPVEMRWTAARSTVVVAKVQPNRAEDLTGPDAMWEWPFPDTVWVVTGWNPQGIRYRNDQNAKINKQIAADIVDSGGRFVDGLNRNPDESVVETLVVWGIDRGLARELGSRANQDAIYEITADAVSLVSCRSDRVETWSRT